ncbi:MAG: ATP-binding protein [Burkholderiaceae bacterium]|nr:ATP-binding protein [Burkholderiaceae bacterium]
MAQAEPPFAACHEHPHTLAQAALDSLTSHLCVLDAVGRIVAVNEPWRRFAAANDGLPQAVGVGADYLAVCDRAAAQGAPDAAAFAAALREVLAGQRLRHESEYACHAPHEQRWFVVRVTRLSGSEPPQVVVSRLDITARRQAELALHETAHRYRQLFDANPHPMWIYDPKTLRFLVVNDAAVALYGYAREQFLRMTLADIRPAADVEALRAAVARASDDMRWPEPWRHRCSDGRLIDVEISAQGIDFEGRPARVVLAHDVTQRRAAEARQAELQALLLEAQKMKAVGQLAGGIAHDFNNIIGAVLGNAAMALADLPPEHRATACVQQIQKAGLRARSLTQKLLSFARPKAPALHVQPLRPLVLEAAELLQATLPSTVALRTRVPDDDALCARVDATQVNQVLMNLGTNAWHALQGRPGTVEVGLERRDATTVNLWVRDDGCGIDADVLPRIFDPFFTTKPAGQGTGLGLAIVRDIVSGLGGELGVASVPGRGSRFLIELPLADAPPALPTDTIPGPLHMASGMPARRHVLVVDDDEAVCLLLTRLLQRAGLKVSGICDAEQALKHLDDPCQVIDLVVSDYNMPRASGLDIARAAAARPFPPPVILISAHWNEAALDTARRLGVAAVLHKESVV